MTMNVDIVQNFIITLQNSTDDKDVSKILGSARVQLDALLVKDAPPLSEAEKMLPTKMQRVYAYKNRAQVSITVAHAVVNSYWREETKHREVQHENG